MDGGPGSDLIKGLDGNDKLFGRDDTRDSLDGGAGIDVGLFDDPLDAVLRIETVL
jgi:Ca2+-binding RTX toxin-like protein